MRITIGRGSSAQSVVVPQGRAFRSQPYVERQRFERDFCHLAGVSRTETIHQVARRQQYLRDNPSAGIDQTKARPGQQKASSGAVRAG